MARTADLPLNGATNSDEAADASSSKCPFLAQLRTPPMVDLPWWQRVQFQVRAFPATPATAAACCSYA